VKGRRRRGRLLGLGLVGTVVVVVALHGVSLLRDQAAPGEPVAAGVTASPAMRPAAAPDRTRPPRFVPAPAPGEPVADRAGAASSPRRGDFEGNDE
jgi:hypothetical protein